MNYGYVRVSTSEQNTDRQLDAMKELGIEHIYIDKFTGISFDRPNYEKLRRRMKSGDVLFVKSLDRFGRKYTAVLDEWRYLAKKGVAVVVMDMPILDTRSRGGTKTSWESSLLTLCFRFCHLWQKVSTEISTRDSGRASRPLKLGV